MLTSVTLYLACTITGVCAGMLIGKSADSGIEDGIVLMPSREHEKRLSDPQLKYSSKCCADFPFVSEKYAALSNECHLKFDEDAGDKIIFTKQVKQACRYYCLGHKLNLLDGEGFIKEEEPFLDYLFNQCSNNKLEDEARYAAYDCLRLGNRVAKWEAKKRFFFSPCNEAFAVATKCVRAEIILNCPKKYINDNEKCDAYIQSLRDTQEDNRNGPWMSK